MLIVYILPTPIYKPCTQYKFILGILLYYYETTKCINIIKYFFFTYTLYIFYFQLKNNIKSHSVNINECRKLIKMLMFKSYFILGKQHYFIVFYFMK